MVKEGEIRHTMWEGGQNWELPQGLDYAEAKNNKVNQEVVETVRNGRLEPKNQEERLQMKESLRWEKWWWSIERVQNRI